MAAVAELHAAPLLLSVLMQDSPTLALLQAVAWFDPESLRSPTPAGYIDFDYDAEDEQTVALYICRSCFPDVYAGANALLMSGASEARLAQFICEGISTHLVTPVESLDELRTGPPLQCFGVDPALLADVSDEDGLLYRSQSIFALFGLEVEDHAMDGAWSVARLVADILHQSLKDRTATPYQDLDTLLTWMFSFSGNSLVDWSQEEMWESGAEYPDWTPDEIEFVNDMTQEALDLMQAVERGLTLLESDKAFAKALRHNTARVFNYIKKRKQQYVRQYLTDDECAALARRLAWPERDGNGAHGEADAHA